MRNDVQNAPKTTDHDAGGTTSRPHTSKGAPESERLEVTAGEFKLTIRKLEMPVRPRGVLAE